MIIATVTGNVGKDAVTKSAGRGTVTEFSVASNHKDKGEKVTTWIRCSLWGTRGDKLAPHITKGKTVAVAGALTTHEHDGKTYLNLNVSEFDFTGSKPDNQRGGAGTHRDAPAPTGGGYDDGDKDGYGETAADDDIPF